MDNFLKEKGSGVEQWGEGNKWDEAGGVIERFKKCCTYHAAHGTQRNRRKISMHANEHGVRVIVDDGFLFLFF